MPEEKKNDPSVFYNIFLAIKNHICHIVAIVENIKLKSGRKK